MTENIPSPDEPSVPPEESETPELTPPEPETSPVEEPKPEKRPSFFARALRWLLVVLVLFGLGTVLVIFALYIPVRSDLKNARRNVEQISEQSESERERAEAALQEANQEIERLAGFEGKNKALQKELEQANLRITLLQVRTDILTAQLALISGDNEKALLALTTTPEALNTLADLLPAKQNDFIQSLQKRLDLALEGIGNDDPAAESDLNVLITKLLELEDAVIR